MQQLRYDMGCPREDNLLHFGVEFFIEPPKIEASRALRGPSFGETDAVMAKFLCQSNIIMTVMPQNNVPLVAYVHIKQMRATNFQTWQLHIMDPYICRHICDN